MAAISKGSLKEPPVKWKVKEQLILASAVQRSGDQNWVSVSRSVKPFIDESRAPEFYSQKSCATQYSMLLDKAGTPRRKRKDDGTQESVETVEEQIVRHLTSKRIKELDRNLLKIKEQYLSMKKEIELIERGELDDKLVQLLDEESNGRHEERLKRISSSSAHITPPPPEQTNSAPPSPAPLPSTTSNDNGSTTAAANDTSTIADTSTVANTTETKTTPTQRKTSNVQENRNEMNDGQEERGPVENETQPMEVDQPPAATITTTKESSITCNSATEDEDTSAAVSKPKATEDDKSSEESTCDQEQTESVTSTDHDYGHESVKHSINNDVPGSKDAVVKQEETTINSAVESPLEGDNTTPSIPEICSVDTDSVMIKTEPVDLTSSNTPSSPLTTPTQVVTPTTLSFHDVSADVSTSVEETSESVAMVIKTDELERKEETDNIGKETDTRKKKRRRKSIRMAEEKQTAGDDDKGTESETEEEYRNETEEDDDYEEIVSPRPLPRRTSSRRGSRKRDVSWDSNRESPLLKSAKSHERSRRSTRFGDKEEGSPAPPTGRRGRGRRGRGRGRAHEPRISPKLDEESDEDQMSSAIPSPATSQGDNESETPQALRTWRKTIMLVWRHAAQHKYANLFLHPVKEEDAPGYHDVILRPMDLSTIKKNIETGVIHTDVEFQRDMMLMFQNALMYNSSDHAVYKMAEEMRNDIVEHIQDYLVTQLMVQSSTAKALRSRDMAGKQGVAEDNTGSTKSKKATPISGGGGVVTGSDDTPVLKTKGRGKSMRLEPRISDE